MGIFPWTNVLKKACPACRSKRYNKKGHARHGKQHHYCKACEPQFSASTDHSSITHEQCTLIESLHRGNQSPYESSGLEPHRYDANRAGRKSRHEDEVIGIGGGNDWEWMATELSDQRA